jgi:hypothetical protein
MLQCWYHNNSSALYAAEKAQKKQKTKHYFINIPPGVNRLSVNEILGTDYLSIFQHLPHTWMCSQPDVTVLNNEWSTKQTNANNLYKVLVGYRKAKNDVHEAHHLSETLRKHCLMDISTRHKGVCCNNSMGCVTIWTKLLLIPYCFWHLSFLKLQVPVTESFVNVLGKAYQCRKTNAWALGSYSRFLSVSRNTYEDRTFLPTFLSHTLHIHNYPATCSSTVRTRN